jgi:hypothetical protein
MKFLFDDSRIANSAVKWAGKHPLVMAGFFFWNSGSTMQMSRIGLLQSLLYQCLVNRLDLIPTLFPIRWSRYTLFGCDTQPWTWSELTSALKLLLSTKDLSFLLFIDGLDEFDGNPQGLVSLILDLQRLSSDTVKLCVASRPWLVFEEAFQRCPGCEWRI